MRDPEQSLRSLRARVAAHTKWARTADATRATAPARLAFLSRFERQVDPDGVLPPAERVRRAASLKRAYFSQLAYKSVMARRRR